MRHIILSLLLFLSSATTLVADDNPVLDLMLIDHCFLLDDTATLNKLYRDLEPRIARSSRWQDKFYYYKLRADYYFGYEEFVNQAIADYKTALSAFPNDAFPNLDYMETNYELCGRTRQTLWSAVQMLTQKLCCQTIHDCPKVVPLHYESE